MKRFCLSIGLLFGLLSPALSGCGGSGTNEVIEVDPNAGGLSQTEQQKYEEAMRSRTERSN